MGNPDLGLGNPPKGLNVALRCSLHVGSEPTLEPTLCCIAHAPLRLHSSKLSSATVLVPAATLTMAQHVPWRVALVWELENPQTRE